MNYIKKTSNKHCFIYYCSILIIGIIIFFISMFFWNYFESGKHQKLQYKIKQYEFLSSQLYNNNLKYIEIKEKNIIKKDDIYSFFIGFEIARLAVNNGDFKNAEKILVEILSNTTNLIIKDLVNLRIARIKLEQGDADKAIFFISNIKNKSWKSISNITLGDAFLLKGDKINSKKTYTIGLENENSKFVKTILMLKLNQFF
ncbi:YfgM family protein [Candidatus Providencia siddallii]|uniref:UPF0070 protein YfgM n=1 Tax=Candidatus Providencia siddallii TaxID=1715285 RepID=A0ABP1CFL4_9GAMM